MMDDRAHISSEPLESGAARRFWGRVILPVIAAGVVALGLAGGGLYWAVNRGDTISVERQMRVADAAIGASIEQLSQGVIPYAVWDDPVLRLSLPYDPDWFRDHVGSPLDLIFPGTEDYMLRPDDSMLYAYIDGRTLPLASFAQVRPALASMIDEVRDRTRPRGHTRDRLSGVGPAPHSTGVAGRNDYIVFAAHLARVRGRPAAVSIIRLTPGSANVAQLRGQEPLLVIIRYLDATFLTELAERHLIRAPRFAETNTPASGETAMRLADDNGHGVGYLIWRPELPGTRLMRVLGPLTAPLGVVITGIMALLIHRLHEAMRKVEASEADAKHIALHDPLTGLPNRVLFADQLEHAIARARRGHIGALLLLDLDRFKTINDTLGHAAGDGVLKEFARRLRAMLRAGDIAARFGGDEFGAILSDVRGRSDVEAVCRRILAATARPIGLTEGMANVGVSIGVAMLPDAGPNLTETMRAADRALYWAKDAGRECYRLFDADPEAALAKMRVAA